MAKLKAAVGAVAAQPGWSELRRASEDLHAAEVLLGDPLVPARSVVPALREFWRSMLAAAEAAQLGAPPNADARASGDPTAWLDQELPDVDAKLRARLGRSWATLEAQEGARAKSKLRAHAEDARALLAIVEPIVGGVPLRRRKRRLLWTALGLFILFAPLALYVAMNTSVEGEGPWRASYFTDRKLESDPIIRREASVDHDWKKDAPLEAVPPDKFSVRWDTCLQIGEAGPVVFQVNANDAARVFVDGEVVIDAWERDPGTRKRGRGAAEVELEVGTHHLRVEYFESLGVASIKLAASFDGEPPGELPSERLSYPGDEFDEDDPCGLGHDLDNGGASEAEAEVGDASGAEASEADDGGAEASGGQASEGE